MRTIVGLAIVIAVIWGLAWILRQVKTGRDPQVSTAGLASVAALTLGSGRSVHLVRAGTDYVLLGVAEQGLVPIHRYTEDPGPRSGPADARSAAAAPTSLAAGRGRAPRAPDRPERVGAPLGRWWERWAPSQPHGHALALRRPARARP